MLQAQHNIVRHCVYMHTNITTCSVTQSQCPVFLFFNFINLFFKILMYWSSAYFSGWFRLKGKSRKTFDIIISTNSCYLNSGLGVLGGLQRCSPTLGVPLPEVYLSVCPYTRTASSWTWRCQQSTDPFVISHPCLCCRFSCTVSTRSCTTTCRKHSTSRRASWVSRLWSRYCKTQAIFTERAAPGTWNAWQLVLKDDVTFLLGNISYFCLISVRYDFLNIYFKVILAVFTVYKVKSQNCPCN
jgi:hypothetical protein